jgi:hypothetical protein
MSAVIKSILMLFFVVVVFSVFVFAQEANEFKIKRENDFSFQVKPTVEKMGEGFNISFEVKSYCDVTIVIEETSSGKIIRHLHSGVLGSNAPEPFQKNSKIQKIYFDGKNDAGEYFKNFTSTQVRVSLGLMPQYDKSLFDIPKKRHGKERQLLSSIEEGVVVYDGGNNVDLVKVFSHSGEYIRTIYPFPSDKIKEVKGLKWRDSPDGSGKFPVKTNFLQTSFLETGSNFANAGRVRSNAGTAHYGMYGKAASFFSANQKSLVLGMGYVARIGMDGSSGGLDLMGPVVGYQPKVGFKDVVVQPNSAAISPQNKKVYFTAYHVCKYGEASNKIVTNIGWSSFHHVYEMNLDSNEPPTIFMGDPEKAGKDENSFNLPVYVFVDDNERVYVCDYLNNRLQIFSADKKLLKSVSVPNPAFVTMLPKSKEVVVISHMITNNEFQYSKTPVAKIPGVYYNLGKFEAMKVDKAVPLPTEYDVNMAGYIYDGSGFELGLTVTDWSGQVRLWASREKVHNHNKTGGNKMQQNIKIWQLKESKFELFKDFEAEIEKELSVVRVAFYSRLRLQVNPVTGDLFCNTYYTGFDGKSIKDLYKIKTDTGKMSIMELPFDAEDYCFDHNGFLYLKSQDVVGRYNVDLMKEVPWDYGIETKASTSASSDRKVGELLSGLKTPTFAGWHQGGIFVGLNGNIVISGPYEVGNEVVDKYTPEYYPGRPGMGKMNNLIHIFDKYGKLIKSDIVPGLKDNYGVGLDQHNNVYMMNGSTRVIAGQRYSNNMTGTVMKFPFSGGKILYKGDGPIPVPLPVAQEPKRPLDLENLWAENASWFFGGVGFMGKNSGSGCACWNSRMTFDYLNRTFAPELERYSIAVLDSNGNLITRIGRYGNRDSMGPKSLKPVGGDEVTLVHGAYLATLSDKFLYIADIGNDRIVSVSLNYATNETTSFPDKK